MEESRVKKFEQYRNSISKEGSKNFRAPSNEEVSTEMRLFLKLKNRKIIENLLIIGVIIAIVLVLVIFGIKLFGR